MEDTEEFIILINSSDSNVLIVQPNATVIIVDSNGKKTILKFVYFTNPSCWNIGLNSNI